MPAALITTYGAPTSGGGAIQTSPGGALIHLGPGQNYVEVSPAQLDLSPWSGSGPSFGPGPGFGPGLQPSTSNLAPSKTNAGAGGGGGYGEWLGDEDQPPVVAPANNGGLLGLLILVGVAIALTRG